MPLEIEIISGQRVTLEVTRQRSFQLDDGVAQLDGNPLEFPLEIFRAAFQKSPAVEPGRTCPGQ